MKAWTASVFISVGEYRGSLCHESRHGARVYAKRRNHFSASKRCICVQAWFGEVYNRSKMLRSVVTAVWSLSGVPVYNTPLKLSTEEFPWGPEILSEPISTNRKERVLAEWEANCGSIMERQRMITAVWAPWKFLPSSLYSVKSDRISLSATFQVTTVSCPWGSSNSMGSFYKNGNAKSLNVNSQKLSVLFIVCAAWKLIKTREI